MICGFLRHSSQPAGSGRLVSNARFLVRVLLARDFAADQWPMPVEIKVAHTQKRDDDDEPVDVVCDNCAIRRRVCPAENAIKYAPSASAVEFRATALHVSQGRS